MGKRLSVLTMRLARQADHSGIAAGVDQARQAEQCADNKATTRDGWAIHGVLIFSTIFFAERDAMDAAYSTAGGQFSTPAQRSPLRYPAASDCALNPDAAQPSSAHRSDRSCRRSQGAVLSLVCLMSLW